METIAYLPVQERFASFQGEGIHMGRSAFFIRTYGCPVRCPWCDSAGTWHPDFPPGKSLRVPVEDLVVEARQSGAEFIVLTGGEPCIHEGGVRALSEQARLAGIRLHVETCGAFALPPKWFDWITVSPKQAALPVEEMLAAAHELKIIVEDSGSVEHWMSYIKAAPGVPVWLHPEWTKRADPAVLSYIVAEVKTRGGRFRAGYQLHKLYRCDALDSRSSPPVPLGGDPAKGF